MNLLCLDAGKQPQGLVGTACHITIRRALGDGRDLAAPCSRTVCSVVFIRRHVRLLPRAVALFGSN